MSMFGWDLTRLTTNALAEMDCTCGGEEIPWCVCVVVGVNQKEKKENACTYDTPPQWEHLFIQDPQSAFITHLKKFTNVLPTTKPTKDNDSTKFLIKAGFLTHTRTSVQDIIKQLKKTYPMSDTICSTMCLLKVMITKSFWGTKKRNKNIDDFALKFRTADKTELFFF